MSAPVRISRKDFVNELATRPIRVADASADARLARVDVKKADLDGDGQISGRREAGALFDELDRVDTNKKATSLDLTGKNGATPVAELVAAVGDLAKAGKLQRLGRSAEPGNDDVLFVGMRKATKDESRALEKRSSKFDVTFVGGSETTIKSGGKKHDLTDRAGIDAFVATLGLPADQSTRIADAIENAPESGRNELAGIAKVWAEAEKGGSIPSRMVISGHHAFNFFGDHGTLGEDNVWELARAMPKAAAQVEDIHLSGCYTLGRDTIHDWQDAFPKLETLWAYDQTAPDAHGGAQGAEAKWDAATRGRIGILGREAAKKTAHADQVIVWSRTGGYDDGKAEPAKADLEARVANGKDAFDEAMRGDRTFGHHGNELRDYYNAVRDLGEHGETSATERAALKDRGERTIRLLYFDSVSKEWAKANDAVLTEGYAAAGLAKPSFAKLDRAQSNAKIDAFLTATERSRDPAILAAREKLIALRDLDPVQILPEWIH